MKNSFTLIEVLVIVSIIAILASTIFSASATSSLKRAKDANFKTMVSSIHKQLISCCDMGGQIQDANNGDICNPELKALYPDSIILSEITVNQNCSGDGSFEVVFKPGVKNRGYCEEALCSASRCNYTGCP